jgi:NitT/TauT family transport system permease protein
MSGSSPKANNTVGIKTSMSALPIAVQKTRGTNTRPKRRSRGTGSLFRLVRRGAAFALFIGLWQLASQAKLHFLINFGNVPGPVAVAGAFIEFVQSPDAARHIGASLIRIFSGFGIGAILAVPIGIWVARSRAVEDTLLTPLEILRPIPVVAWIPLSILMFATAEQSIIYICFIGAFYPILLSTIHGVKGIDRRLLNAAQSLGAGRWEVFWEVILPGAFPSIVTGLSIGMGTCWFSLITAEMMAGQFGIGYLTWESYTLQNYPQIVVGMVLIGLLGMLSSLLVRKLGSMLMPWTMRGGATG